jgi:phosphatidylinositol-binding clathrin assembly protein
MINNGATDNVLQYLSSSDVLRLKNVGSGQWDGPHNLRHSHPLLALSPYTPGYKAPENLQFYAVYLDTRIRAYKDLKHDAVRVQSENNRDLRLSASLEEDGHRSKHDQSKSGPTRSKTVVGRKLRVMTVEKGLLRETRIVQTMVDALVRCQVRIP